MRWDTETKKFASRKQRSLNSREQCMIVNTAEYGKIDKLRREKDDQLMGLYIE